MGELVVYMFTSLDGVLQGPGAPGEDREGGFEHGGWQAPYFDEESGKIIGDHIAGLEALLLGRKTYEIFAAAFPKGAVRLTYERAGKPAFGSMAS